MATHTNDMTWRVVLDLVDHQTRPMLAAQRAQNRAIEQQRRELAQAGGSLTRYAERQTLAASKSTASYRRTGAAATTMGAETRRAGEQAARAASAQERAAIVAQRVGRSYRQEAIEARSLARAQGETARATQHAARTQVAAARTQETARTRTRRTMLGGAASAAGGLAAGTAAAAGLGIAAAVKSAVGFEQQMARVRAVSSATGKEFGRLKAQALDLGAKTQFSAKDVADAMYSLSTAGFTARQTMKTLPGTLSLAAASGQDLASSAELQASTLRAFGLRAGDAGKVADSLAYTTNKSAVEMGDLGDSLKYVAPLSRPFHQSMQDMLGSLGVLGNVGIKGEQAGTTIRTALVRLTAPTKQAQGGLDALRISSSDLYGPKGMRPLPQIIGKMAAGSKGLSIQTRNAAIAHIFGREALSGMINLFTQGQKPIDRFSRGVERSGGYAARAAKIMRGTAAGAWDNLTGSVETAVIKLSDPVMHRMAAGLNAGAGGVNHFVSALSGGRARGIGGTLGAGARQVGREIGRMLSALKPAVPFVTRVLIPALKGVAMVVLGPFKLVAPVIRTVANVLGALGKAAKHVPGLLQAVGVALAILVARSSMVAGATGRVGTAIRVLTTPLRLLTSLLVGMPAAYTRAGAAAGVMARETQVAAASTRRAASTLGPGVLTGRAAAAAPAAAGATGLLARGREYVGGIGGWRGAAGLAGRGALIAAPLGALALSQVHGKVGGVASGALTGAMIGGMAGPWGAAAGAAVGGALALNSGPNRLKTVIDRTQLRNAVRLRQELFTADRQRLQGLREEVRAASHSGTLSKSISGAQAAALSKMAAARDGVLAARAAQRAAVSFTAGFNQVKGAKNQGKGGGFTNLLPDLAPMTAEMRGRGAKAMIALAAGLERNHRLPQGATDKVIRQLTNRYGDLVPSLAHNGMLSMRAFDNAIKRSRVVATARGQIADIKKTWAEAPNTARITSTNAQRVFSAQIAFLRAKVAGTQGAMKGDAERQLGALVQTARRYGVLAKEQGAIGWRDYGRQMNQVFSNLRSGATDVFTSVTRLAQVAGAQALNSMGGGGGGGGPARSRGGPQGLPGTGRRRGGRVFRAGGLVDVMLSPGEEVQHGGGSWMVPGARTAADTVHAQVPSGAAVITGHGQQMMAQGATVNDAIREQMPHFRAGGKVDRPELARYDRRHTPFQIGSAPRSARMPFRIARAVGEYMGASPGRAYQFAQIGRGEGGGGGDPYPGVYSNRPDDRGMGWLQMTPYAHGRNNWGAGMLASYRALGGRMWEQGGGTVYNPFTSMRLALKLGGGGLGPWFGTRYLTAEQRRESILAPGVKGHHLGKAGRRSMYDAGGGYRWHHVTQTRTVKGTPHAALGPVRIDRFNIGNYLSGNPADAFSTAYQAALEGPYRGLLAGRARNSTLRDQFDQILEASRIQMVTPEKQVKTRRWIREKGPPGPGRRAAAARVAPSMSAARAVGLGRFDGLPVAKWIIPEARYARAHGWRGRITSGYRSHAHNVAQGRLYRSEHEGTAWPHGAIDFGGFTSGLGNKLAFMRAAVGYRGPKVRAPIGFRDDGHASGTGHRRGGIVRMRTGGRVDAARGAAMSALAASRSHAASAAPRPAARAAAGRLFGHGQAATVTRGIFTARPAANLEVRGDLFHLAELIDGTIATHIRTTIAGLRRRVTQLSHGRRTGGKLAETAGLKAQIRMLDRQLAGVAAPTFNGLVKRMHQVQGEIRKLAKGGLTRSEHVQVNRLRAVLALMQTEAGRRVGNIVAAVAAQTTRLERQRTGFDLRLRRLNIPAESARGQDALAKLLAAQGRAMRKQVTDLRRARDRALKAGDRGTAKEINSQLDELNATVRETAVALIEAQRSAVLTAAQDIVDRADFAISMASGWGDIADNAAKLAGTADTPAARQSHADYVNTVVIPAIDKKIAADTQAGQSARAIFGENSSQFRDAVLAWMGDIKSRQDAQLDAQGAIADNTAATADQLKQVGGQLSFGFGGQQFTDDLINSGVGA